jgi:hypothetical protein
MRLPEPVSVLLIVVLDGTDLRAVRVGSNCRWSLQGVLDGG